MRLLHDGVRIGVRDLALVRKHRLTVIFLVPALLATVLAICGLGFYLLSLWSAHRFQQTSSFPPPAIPPPVSILKPLRGVDPQMYESFRSHCLQDYPEYELISGVSEPKINSYSG